MNSKIMIFPVVAVVVLGLFAGHTEGGLMDRPYIDGIPCSRREVASMTTNCMIRFATGSNLANIIQLMLGSTCDHEYINCDSVIATQRCMADMTNISPECRTNMHLISNRQFSEFGIPCVIQDFQNACEDEFRENGLIQ